MKTHALLLLGLLLFYAPSSLAAGPAQQLQQAVDRVLATLEEPGRCPKDQKQDTLCRIARKAFDFDEFADLSIAEDRHTFVPKQVRVFKRLFARFLCRFYSRELLERYSNERVVIHGQKFLGDSRALVELDVLWKNLEIPVSVYMLNSQGAWKVYDLRVLGIGAARIYREQIHEILADMTPDELIALVKNRLASEQDHEQGR